MTKWVRVRDIQTKHTFDIDGRALPYRRGVEPVNDPERWPDLEGPHARPRPAKPFVEKDGLPRRADGDEVPEGVTTGGGSVDQPTSRAKRNGGRNTSTPADVPADTQSEGR